MARLKLFHNRRRELVRGGVTLPQAQQGAMCVWAAADE